jgi:penicillin-binding protein 1A
VQSFSVFPNDGIRIQPHYIRKVTQADGTPLDEPLPQVTEVISVETARTMMQFLQAVTHFGTGAAAAQLKHPLGGKTGTTNDFTDAWFLGFSPSVTCGTWIGFDNRQSLGDKETGARAALPMWMDFMRVAIAGKPDEQFPSGGEPEKQLDVPVNAPPGAPPPAAQPSTKPAQDADPDAPEDSAPKPVATPAPTPATSPVSAAQ